MADSYRALVLLTVVISLNCIVPAVFGFSIHGRSVSQCRSKLSHEFNDVLLSERLSWPVVMHESADESALEESESSSESEHSKSEHTRDLPPVLQQIADERKEYNMNVGKAMDTLRKDMADILSKTPDFSIYHDDIIAVDPSGVRLQGLDKYKSAFAFFQTFLRFWFAERSGLQFRMVYDFCRSSIRISWHAVLVPKVPLGKPLMLDGISMYKLNAKGEIVEHKIENLVINNNAVVPPYGIFSILQQDLMRQPKGVPVGVGLGAVLEQF